MRIKICGLKSESDIEIVNKFPPDYAGFVFAESKRKVSANFAKELITKLNPEIKSVGVFVNEAAKTVAETAKTCNLYAVQLHGDESEAYISELKNLCGAKIIKCVRTKSYDYVLQNIRTKADAILFDTFSKTARGGTGERADWELILQVRGNMEKPFFLAGGISETNICAAFEINPYAADVSSGAEKANGEGKDEEKVRKLIYAVRNFNQQAANAAEKRFL
ncbi:MAG: phosphoribosylanthranilate isomerase [Clostridiales bacterium]|jgi:phosphoribosylanthranilate isomerase|nr:phosphoribosylanthranilate isomerase [Clostridiales bacterium]